MGGCAAWRRKQHVPMLRLLRILLSVQCWRILWRGHHKSAQHSVVTLLLVGPSGQLKYRVCFAGLCILYTVQGVVAGDT